MGVPIVFSDQHYEEIRRLLEGISGGAGDSATEITLQGLLDAFNLLDRDLGISTPNTLRVSLSDEQETALIQIAGILTTLSKGAGATSPTNTLRIVLADESVAATSTVISNRLVKDDNGDYYTQVIKYNAATNVYSTDYLDKDGIVTGSVIPPIFVVAEEERTIALDQLRNREIGAGAAGNNFRVTISQKSITPGLQLVTNSGTLPTATYSEVSILNAGLANGTVLGVTLKPNQKVSWSCVNNDVLTAIAYDATGTEFLIQTKSW